MFLVSKNVNVFIDAGSTLKNTFSQKERCTMTATKGLEGIVAATSSISSIVDGVLTYRGYDINDLALHASFEEVAYLLWFGKLPNAQELNDLKRDLDTFAPIPQTLIEQMKLFPKDTNTMAALRTAISALALYDEEADDMSRTANEKKAVKLQAQLPTIVAALSRIRQGKEPVQPQKGLTIAENFLFMLRGEQPDETSIKALDQALVLHADHEFNASTFAGRVTVATLSDIYSGVTSAIGALKGPLHGGANEAVMKMLEEIGGLDQVESYIQDKLNKREIIMGFGHRVYKNGDPRAKYLQKMSRELSEMKGNSDLYEMSVKIEEMVTGQKGLKPNVDFYSASVYTQLGIERELFTPIFAISRVSGWTAHMLEQWESNRIIRPRAEYIGLHDQKYISIELR